MRRKVRSESIVAENTLLRAENRCQHNEGYAFLYPHVPPQLLIPLDEIELRECIGFGHFGVVYRALLNRNTRTQDVAVKAPTGTLFLERDLTNYPLCSVDERQTGVLG